MREPAQHITATILGCGSSGGVPRVGGDWGDCDPKDPKSKRTRCALLLTGTGSDKSKKTHVLIDTGCDMRSQLLSANVTHLDGVFYTHEHADHTHGIDDLRALALASHARIDVYFAERTKNHITNCFSYCFSAPKGSEYPPILNANEIFPGQEVTIEGEGGTITLLPILQTHGSITTLGYRIKNFLYSCDVSDFPEESHAYLTGLDTWILDALRPTPHPSHLSLPQSLDWIARFEPKRAILTNLHINMNYQNISQDTPENVAPAYDGMQIEIR